MTTSKSADRSKNQLVMHLEQKESTFLEHHASSSSANSSFGRINRILACAIFVCSNFNYLYLITTTTSIAALSSSSFRYLARPILPSD